MSDHMRAAENAYRETMAELRVAEGGGFKAASQHRRALEAAITAAAPFIASQAWEAGMRSGKSHAMRKMSDEPNLSLNIPNPYRSEQ